MRSSSCYWKMMISLQRNPCASTTTPAIIHSVYANSCIPLLLDTGAYVSLFNMATYEPAMLAPPPTLSEFVCIWKLCNRRYLSYTHTCLVWQQGPAQLSISHYQPWQQYPRKGTVYESTQTAEILLHMLCMLVYSIAHGFHLDSVRPLAASKENHVHYYGWCPWDCRLQYTLMMSLSMPRMQ